MNRIILRTALAMTAAGALGSSTAVLAANPLGAYIGAGVGVSNVGNDNYYNYNYGYNGGYGNEVAWKGMIGIRPIAFVGAELEYIDFGSSNGQNGCYGYGCGYGNYYYSTPSSHPKATVLYGVGYLPLPFLDVYGKLGVARLQTNQSAYYSVCPMPRRAAYGQLSNRPVERQVRVRRRRANTHPGFRVPRRIRGHQLAVRQPGRSHGRLYVGVLANSNARPSILSP